MKSPLQYIEHIRTKPHHVRKRVALAATLLIGGAITITWATYESQKLAIVYPEQRDALAGATGSEQAASPFQALKNIFDTAN